jgi:outer membrane murein-binding lipoprotein Lpp
MSDKDKETVKLTAKTPVRTDLATLYAVIIATAVLVGGLVTIKRDISDLAAAGQTKESELRSLREDVNKIMFHLLIQPTSIGSKK